MIPEILKGDWFIGDGPSIAGLERSLENRGSYFLGNAGIYRVEHETVVPVNFKLYVKEIKDWDSELDCLLQVVCLDKTLMGQYGKEVSGWARVLEVFKTSTHEIFRPENEGWIFAFVFGSPMGRRGEGKFWVAADFWEIWKAHLSQIAGSKYIDYIVGVHPGTFDRTVNR